MFTYCFLRVRADDAPPYFTILIVGHFAVPAMLMLEELRHAPEWVHLAVSLPLMIEDFTTEHWISVQRTPRTSLVPIRKERHHDPDRRQPFR